MDIPKFILDLVGKFQPFKIENNLNVENLNVPIQIGTKTFQVKDGNILLDEGAEIPLIKGADGLLRPSIKEVSMEGLSQTKEENVKNLDVNEKIFTRSDIGLDQVELLTIKEVHEGILKKLIPILKGHLRGQDLGAILSSSAIIRIEDEGKDEAKSKRLHGDLLKGFPGRGAMIYNVFRSDLLRTEVLNYLNNLRRMYNEDTEIKMLFLMYWDSIIENGYPTAVFVKSNDTQGSVFIELDWRFAKGHEMVNIYSRGDQRNLLTEKWCKEYAKENGGKYKKNKEYKLGFTPAVKCSISINK